MNSDSSYDFPLASMRARPVKIVDGDTIDLFVDVGFHSFRKERFRLYGIDTPELRSKNKKERAAAKDAKKELQSLSWGVCTEEEDWPLRIETFKDPDNFGRYLCKLYTTIWVDDDNLEEICINDYLVEKGFAVYRTY